MVIFKHNKQLTGKRGKFAKKKTQPEKSTRSNKRAQHSAGSLPQGHSAKTQGIQQNSFLPTTQQTAGASVWYSPQVFRSWVPKRDRMGPEGGYRRWVVPLRRNLSSGAQHFLGKAANKLVLCPVRTELPGSHMSFSWPTWVSMWQAAETAYYQVRVRPYCFIYVTEMYKGPQETWQPVFPTKANDVCIELR